MRGSEKEFLKEKVGREQTQVAEEEEEERQRCGPGEWNKEEGAGTDSSTEVREIPSPEDGTEPGAGGQLVQRKGWGSWLTRSDRDRGPEKAG